MLPRLQAHLPAGTDVRALYSTYLAQRPDGDPATFAVWLHERQQLSPAALKAYLLDTDLHLNPTVAPPTPYERLALLGKGAMGEVFLARDRRLNRNVAVKQMEARLAGDPELVRRFHHEAQITAQLDHPAIVPVFDLEVAPDGALSYGMRVVRGRTLTSFLAETRALLDQRQALDATHGLQARLLLFEDLCKVLHYAHERGVLHRDIKPDNVMVGPYGEVLLMDWGIAKVLGAAEASGARPTGDESDGTAIGSTLGTARYMSPEQAAGENQTLDARSDQFTLGLLLYELLALRPANAGKSAEACWMAAAHGRMLPLTPYRGEAIPRDLHAIVAKATARARDDRYADVGQLGEDIRRFLRDEELLARRDGVGQRLQRSVGRHRKAVLGALGALSAAVVLVGAGTLALGAIGLAASVWYADRREDALATLTAQVSDRAHHIDATLARYAGEVKGLRGAASHALTHPAPEDVGPIFFAEDFHGPAERRPPDLADAPAYDAPASLQYPDHITAAGADRTALDPQLRQLQSLHPELLGILRRALPGEPDPDATLRARGGPVVWTYVATTDGVLTGLPGVGEYPEGYDARTQGWYVRGADADEPAWDVADDESGQGLLLTASVAVRAPSGQPLGVVALDIGIDHATRELVSPGTLPARGVLLDDQGRVLVDTDDPQAGFAKPPYANPAVVAAAHDRASGWFEDDDRLYVWTRVETLGWTYVVEGETRALLPVW